MNYGSSRSISISPLCSPNVPFSKNPGVDLKNLGVLNKNLKRYLSEKRYLSRTFVNPLLLMKRKRISAYATPRNIGRAFKIARASGSLLRRAYKSLPSRSKKRAYRRPQRRAKRLTQKHLKKKLKKFCSFIKQQEATHIYRNRAVTQQVCGVGLNATSYYDSGGTLARHQSAVANLRFFDPVTNAMVTADAAAGTYHRDICMSIHRKLTIANNFQTWMEVRVYKCYPKGKTDVTPITAYVTGLADQNGPNTQFIGVYPTDSEDLTGLWNVKMCMTKTLAPGQTVVCSDHQKEFKFDFSLADVDDTAYNSKQGGFTWMVRIQGTLGHDSVVANQVSYMEAGCDIALDATYHIKYDAGKDLHDITSVQPTVVAAFTNTGLQSQKPVSNNLPFNRA